MQSLDLASNFTRIDWAIVAVYLLATVAIGIYANRYVANMGDYIVAGRALRTHLAIATMIGTELGLVTVMYMAQKGFTGGFAAFHIALAAGAGTLVVGLTGFIVVPLREMGVMTIPEFYEKRFGRGVRVLGGVLLVGAGVLNMGLFLKAGGLFVTALTGLAPGPNLKVVMTVLLALVLTYTILGGMVSVVITDYFQFVVLSFGLLVTCVLAVVKVGWSDLVLAVSEVHGEGGFNPLAVGVGFGVEYVIWMILTAGVISSAVWPTAVMRACAAESTQVVRRLYCWSSVGFMIRSLIPMFLGICALGFFWHQEAARPFFFTADGGLINDTELKLQAMPLFLSQVLPAGLIGLVGAGMLAAFMSTHDSYLLCWSSVFVQDVIAPWVPGGLSTWARLLLARVGILLIGIFLLIFGLWYEMENQDLFDYLWITGSIYFVGAFALLVLGIYWKRASRFGAYLALIAGGSAIVGLEPVTKLVGLAPLAGKLGQARLGAIISLSATVLALALLIVGSALVPDRPRATDPQENRS